MASRRTNNNKRRNNNNKQRNNENGNQQGNQQSNGNQRPGNQRTMFVLEQWSRQRRSPEEAGCDPATENAAPQNQQKKGLFLVLASTLLLSTHRRTKMQ